MALRIADLQEPILRRGSVPGAYSLYIGIPFCPSRCSYCSFVSCNLDRDRKLVQPYVDCLCREVEAIRAQADKAGLQLCSIYIGGGTPTSLSADQLRQLMGTVRQNFDLSKLLEYTVEAGRPDCTDAEKLAVIKEYGATRISIESPDLLGPGAGQYWPPPRRQDILDCYAQARAAGHQDINMDLIAGLPGDTVEGFTQSLKQAIALDPENITVHTLTLKRASRIVIEDQKENDYADVAAMLEQCSMLAQAGYQPYYLYRQKNTLQNLENVGWCKPGHEGYYNIYIMEEVQTILSAGAGGSTKLVADGGKRMQRIFNFKYPTEYIQRFAEVLERKEGVTAFYDQRSGSRNDWLKSNFTTLQPAARSSWPVLVRPPISVGWHMPPKRSAIPAQRSLCSPAHPPAERPPQRISWQRNWSAKGCRPGWSAWTTFSAGQSITPVCRTVPPIMRTWRPWTCPW